MSTVAWDDRLISRERAYAVAGEWMMYATTPTPAFWRCHLCAQAITTITPDARVTLDGLVAAVVRHAVTAHDLNLSGAGDGLRPATAGTAAGDGSHDYGRIRAADPVGGHDDQTSGDRRIPGAAAGGER